MKNVLITGSSSGIGKETAKLLKDKGYNVFTHGRREINNPCYIQAPLNSFEDVKALYDKVLDLSGGVDILINNAGEYLYKGVEKTDIEAIKRLTFLNQTAPYYLISLVIPSMKRNKFGRIVNISSISGSVGEAYASLYSMTKSALYGMTKSLALELAGDNITVNSISPGWVETNLTKDIQGEERAEIIDVVPQRRFIEPVEIANLILYLISEEAKGLTGQNINLCAGLSVGS